MKISTITAWLIGIVANPENAQVAYNPNSIPGWSRTGVDYGDSDVFVFSPYDIILDAANTQTLPNNFRTPAFLKPAKANQVDISGFNALRVSGSGQFSESQFEYLIRHLSKAHKVNLKDIIIVDLREEPHGFINGDAVTWYYGPLSYQQFKSPGAVLESEHQRLDLLSTQEFVIINSQSKHSDGMIDSKKPQVIRRINHYNEEQLAKKLGVGYVRIPVTDHFMPEPQDVDLFLKFYQTVGDKKWLHFKCRGGKGRTTTFMTLVDMLKNPKVTKADFFKRQTMIQGTDLTLVAGGTKSWKRLLSKSRLQFIGLFYDYLHAKDGYGHKSWSAWISQYPPDITVTPIASGID